MRTQVNEDVHFEGSDGTRALTRRTFVRLSAAALTLTASRAARAQVLDPGSALVQQGRKYLEGDGVVLNYQKAAQLFQQASDAGSLDGQAWLGSMHLRGHGVERDEARGAGLMEAGMRSFMRSMAALIVLSFLCLTANAASKLPLTLTITAPPPATSGDDIKIPAVLKNISAQIIHNLWPPAQFTVFIHDEHGKVPPFKPGDWGWGSSGAPDSLEPGKTLMEYADLGRYDLVPGRYVVKVTLPWAGIGYAKGTVLESNEITITVLPKKPKMAK